MKFPLIRNLNTNFSPSICGFLQSLGGSWKIIQMTETWDWNRHIEFTDQLGREAFKNMPILCLVYVHLSRVATMLIFPAQTEKFSPEEISWRPFSAFPFPNCTFLRRRIFPATYYYYFTLLSGFNCNKINIHYFILVTKINYQILYLQF